MIALHGEPSRLEERHDVGQRRTRRVSLAADLPAGDGLRDVATHVPGTSNGPISAPRVMIALSRNRIE